MGDSISEPSPRSPRSTVKMPQQYATVNTPVRTISSVEPKRSVSGSAIGLASPIGPGRLNLRLCQVEDDNAELRQQVEVLKAWKLSVEAFLTETLGYPVISEIESPGPAQSGSVAISPSEAGNPTSNPKPEPLKKCKPTKLSTSNISSTPIEQSSSNAFTSNGSSTVAHAFSSKSNENVSKCEPTPSTSGSGMKFTITKKESEISVSNSNGKLPTSRKRALSPSKSNSLDGSTEEENASSPLQPMSEAKRRAMASLGLAPKERSDRGRNVKEEAKSIKPGDGISQRNGVSSTSEAPSPNSDVDVEGDDDEDINIDKTVCDVCWSYTPEEGNKMIFCDNCNVCVHQACYGVKEIPQGEWKCKSCVAGIPVGEVSCRLCTTKGGALVPVNAPGRNSWAHVSCTWWVPEVRFKTPGAVDLVMGIPKVEKARWNLKCYLCKEGKGLTCCIQCKHRQCKTAYHVTCAFKNGLQMNMIDTPGEPEFSSYCNVHRTDGYGKSIVSKPKKKRSRKQ